MKSASTNKPAPVAQKGKKVLLYNPYMDVLGGGERHILSILELLVKAKFTIDIAWDDASILKSIQDTLNFDSSHYNVVENVFKKGNRNKRDALTAQYDIFLYVTDGSYFTSKAKKNIIFSMYPDKKLYKMFPTNWLKIRDYHIIANGEFTAEKVSKWLKKDAFVIYPYIDQSFFTDTRQKKRVILSVGRFFRHLHSKRQDVLIKAFTKLQNSYKEFSDFNLVLAGGLKEEDRAFYDDLQSLAKINNNIVFRPNISFEELHKLYTEAMIYWHASGYGVNENVNPERVEHVGISPLEAMASRCLTICHQSGGPKRYIEQGNTGYLYTSIDDLVSKTANGYAELQKNEKILDNGRLYVGTHFSYPVFKNRVEQFFRI